jgi:hypothetical protein
LHNFKNGQENEKIFEKDTFDKNYPKYTKNTPLKYKKTQLINGQKY